MKKSFLLLLLASVSTLTGCWKKSEPQTFVRPVKLSEVQSLSTYDKEFVGVVSAEQYTNLAFRVGGLINKTFVTEGTFVKKGQLMAELDPGDFRLQLEADKAQYQTTASILQRNKKLLERQAISQQDYEIAEANYQKAKSAYEYSANQLEYSRLRAPFSGSIEKKFVENYQKVNPGEPIYKLINPDILEVKFTLPENDVNITKVGKFFIEFDNFRGEMFAAAVKEIVDASVDGAGIPVTLAIVDKNFKPEKYSIKAGFACRIKVLVDDNRYYEDLFTVPVTAIFSKDNNVKDTFIWVYNPADSTVESRAVKTRGVFSSDRVILEGNVKAGEQVVTAGVYQIVDNQKVNVLQ